MPNRNRAINKKMMLPFPRAVLNVVPADASTVSLLFVLVLIRPARASASNLDSFEFASSLQHQTINLLP